MQDFINHAAIERAAAEAFASSRARLYLLGVLALGVTTTAGLAAASIWLGLALLVDEARRTFITRLSDFSPAQARASSLALDCVSLAVAPALAWYAQSGMGGAVAAVLLAAALSFTAFDARRGRLHTMTACAPYALLGMLFLTDAAGFFAAIACAIGLLYVFAVTLFHVHAASHERRQDAEWIRQLNMSFSDATSAAWEIDFVRKRLIGAPRLEALLGRSVSYADIVDNAFFAAPNDRSLVRAAFSPERGAVRRIALAHDVAVLAYGFIIRALFERRQTAPPCGLPALREPLATLMTQ